ncbi:MAG TPA: ABC transporter substrate-binding protein [Vicinamibacteria bacterium]
MTRTAAAHAVLGLALAAEACRAPAPAPRTRLVIALPVRPGVLPPLLSIAEATNTVYRHAYEPLTELSPDLRVTPCLAESWYCPDDRTWVFRLRRGVRRHDGRLLDARDVAAQLGRAFASGRALAAAGLDVTSVAAPDAGTLVLRTAAPAGWLPNFLAYVLLRFDRGEPGLPPAGTGPYVYGGEAPDGSVVLDAFPGHRDGRPAIDRVVFRVIPEVRRAAALLRAGEVHLVLDVPADEWDGVARDPRLRAAARPGLRVMYLGFNVLANGGRASPVRDPVVRRAIAESIDRREIIDGVLKGLAEPISDFVPPEVFGHAPGLEAAPPFDRGAARARLARVKLPPRPLVLAHPGRQDAPAVAEHIAAGLREVGLAVSTRRGPGYGPRPGPPGVPDPDLFLAGWSSSTGDAALGYYALAHTPGEDADGSLSGTSSPTVDRLLAEAAAAPSQPARLLLLREVAATLAAEVALVPLYRVVDRYAFAAGLEFTPRLDRRLRAQDTRWTHPPPGARLP